jgi:hypothetical protein
VEELKMAERKQFLSKGKADPHLLSLIEKVKERVISEEELQDQRVSFAFGNALNRDFVTKDSVRYTSQHIRLKA